MKKEELQPNETTLKAILEFENLENVESCTADEFFKRFGLDKI